MYNKYLKYKLKYLNLNMIGGTIEIDSLSNDNKISFKIKKNKPIFKLFYAMDKYIFSMIDIDYIEYKLVVGSNLTVLDRTSSRLIQEIKEHITYIISKYKLKFNNLKELVEYINENDTINDYSIYYYIMHKMIYGNLDELNQELLGWGNTQLKEILSYKIRDDIPSMRFTLPLRDQDFLKSIKNKNFILKAIQIDYTIFNYINDKLKEDKDFILKAIQINFQIFQFVHELKKDDENFILESISINSNIFFYVNDQLKNNRDFVFKAIQIAPNIFKYVGDELKKNKELILDGLKIISEQLSIILFIIIYENYKHDNDFMLKIIKINPYFMSKAFELNKDNDFILSAIIIDPISFYYARYDKNDKEFIKKAIEIDPKTFFYVVPNPITESDLEPSSKKIIQDFKNNKEFILNSMKIDSKIFDYATPELKKDREFIEEANKIREEEDYEI